MNEETFYKIKLDLVHNTINNFVHVMQYDDKVAYIKAEIYRDWQPVHPSDEFDSAELRFKKPDGSWIKCNDHEPYIHCAKPSYHFAIHSGDYYYLENGTYINITGSVSEDSYSKMDPNKFYKNIGIILHLEKDFVKLDVVMALSDTYGGCPAVIDFYSKDGHIQTAKFVLDVDRNPIQSGETLTNVPDDAEEKLIELENKIKKAVKFVEQTLTESEKAQARKNIGIDGEFYTKNQIDAALLLKVNRYTGEGSVLYASINGNDTTVMYSGNVAGNTMAYRNQDGRLKIAAPQTDDDAANKKYVTDLLNSEVERITQSEIDILEI